MAKRVVIIGGGIAGLSAGIYAQKCGFAATLLERHSMAGGNCTSWKREGYLFEGSMHWLTGSNPKEPLYKLWRYVGALDENIPIHYREPYREYDHQGTPIRFYRNIALTEKHWLSLAPQDKKEIRKLCKNIRRVQNLSMPIPNLRKVKLSKKPSYPPLSLLWAALAAWRLLKTLSKVSRDSYIHRFSHEGLQHLLRASTHERSGILPLVFTMGTLARGDGGFPEGGSLPFVQRMLKTFTSAGGEILCDTQAQRVVVENGKAVGVLAAQRHFPADAVIVSSDTMAMDALFETPPQAPWIEQMRQNAKPTMATLVSFGLNVNLKNYPKYGVFRLKKPIGLASQTYKYLSFNNYAEDAAYSPPGKTVLTFQLGGDSYAHWKQAKTENRYWEEKQKLADAVMEALCAQIPEAVGHIEVWDMATPLTYERYCGTWKGSWMTEMSPKMKMKTYPSVVPGLLGVYFAGHRMMPPGGLPIALLSGRTAVQYLCRDTHTRFISEE